MLIRTQKVSGLILNNFGYLINVLRFCVRTFGLSSESLLAKTNTFRLFIDLICLHWVLTTSHHSVAAECILAVLGKAVLASYFFDCWIVVYCSFKLIDSLLITTCNSAHRRLVNLRDSIHASIGGGLSTRDGIVLVQVLIACIKSHRPNFGKLHPRFRTGRLIGHIKLPTQAI